MAGDTDRALSVVLARWEAIGLPLTITDPEALAKVAGVLTAHRPERRKADARDDVIPEDSPPAGLNAELHNALGEVA
jgi:hypothetical protein